MTDGERYKALRNHLNLSVQALADKIGLNRKTIYMRESGQVEIGMEAWMALELLDLGQGTHPEMIAIPRKLVTPGPRRTTGGAFGKSRK